MSEWIHLLNQRVYFFTDQTAMQKFLDKYVQLDGSQDVIWLSPLKLLESADLRLELSSQNTSAIARKSGSQKAADAFAPLWRFTDRKPAEATILDGLDDLSPVFRAERCFPDGRREPLDPSGFPSAPQPADGDDEAYDPECGIPFHESSSGRLPVGTVVPRLGPVNWVSSLVFVGRVGWFCPLHRGRGVCWVRPLHRVLPIGGERDVRALVLVGDGVAIKKIFCRLRRESLAGSGGDDGWRPPGNGRPDRVPFETCVASSWACR